VGTLDKRTRTRSAVIEVAVQGKKKEAIAWLKIGSQLWGRRVPPGEKKKACQKKKESE